MTSCPKEEGWKIELATFSPSLHGRLVIINNIFVIDIHIKQTQGKPSSCLLYFGRGVILLSLYVVRAFPCHCKCMHGKEYLYNTKSSSYEICHSWLSSQRDQAAVFQSIQWILSFLNFLFLCMEEIEQKN